MNNYKIELHKVEDKWACILSAVKLGEMKTLTWIVKDKELEALKKFIEFIND